MIHQVTGVGAKDAVQIQRALPKTGNTPLSQSQHRLRRRHLDAVVVIVVFREHLAQVLIPFIHLNLSQIPK